MLLYDYPDVNHWFNKFIAGQLIEWTKLRLASTKGNGTTMVFAQLILVVNIINRQEIRHKNRARTTNLEGNKKPQSVQTIDERALQFNSCLDS